MSMARRRASQVLSGLLLLALATLGYILVRGVPLRTTDSTIDTPAATGSPAPSAIQPSAEGALAPLPTVDLTLAAIVRPSPLQEWASAVLDTIQENLIGESGAALTDSVLPPERALEGALTLAGDGIAVGGQPVVVDEQHAIELVIPAAAGSDAPLRVGRIERRSGTLTLTVPEGEAGSPPESVRSLSGGVMPTDALAALVETAEARDLTLRVAYHETAGQEARLTLLDVQPIAAAAVQATPTPPEVTSTPGPPSGPTSTTIPTLVYQDAIRLTVESKLTSLIDATRRSPDRARMALAYYQQHHPWVGHLTWDEEAGIPLAAGRPLNLQTGEVRRFMIFGLKDQESPVPMTGVLLESTWNGDGTTVDDGQTGQWYYGDRLSEIVYWMVFVAEDHGGQLTVAYDQVGSYRALTVIDFRPLPLSPDT